MFNDIDQQQNTTSLAGLREATCPACGYHVGASFYAGGDQPVATLAWPGTAGQAAEMARLPLDFVRCVDCGHVFNAAFDYRLVPYSEKPNLMYNHGQIWAEYIRGVQREIVRGLPREPTVVGSVMGTAPFFTAWLASEQAAVMWVSTRTGPTRAPKAICLFVRNCSIQRGICGN